MREKLVKIGAFVAVAGLVLTGRAVELDLAGDWTLSGSNEVGRAISCPIAVPGDVHSALFKAKLMHDPFWGCNETNVQWVGRHDWTIERTFDVSDEMLAHKKIVLRLEDCDTFATIWINGKEVGRTHDRFHQWDFDVRNVLKPGRNEIRGLFRSAWLEADARVAASTNRYFMSCEDFVWCKCPVFIRKPACHRGWDWGLAQMTTGFCGPVKLIASDGDRVDYVCCDQAFNADYSHCTLTVKATLETGAVVTNVVEIDNPPPWWSNGAGEQKRLTIGCGLLAVSAMVFAAENDGTQALPKVQANKGHVTLDQYPVACHESRTVEGREPSLLPDGRKFKLVWNDEFDGTALDGSKWMYRTNFWGRNAHWFAKPEDGCVEVKDGLVHLKIRKLPNGQFVSPQLQTGELLWDIPWLENRLSLILHETGRLEYPYGEKVDGEENMFAMRIRKGGNFREFYAYDDGTCVWLLNGYEKKTRKIPMAELRKARKIKRKYGL